jgi:hypothetical protein
VQLRRIEAGVSSFRVVTPSCGDARSQASPPQALEVVEFWTFVIRLCILSRKAAKPISEECFFWFS